MSTSGSDKKDSLDPTLFELFANEIETRCTALNQGVIELEKNPHDAALFSSLMRAAHSIKGAARVINLEILVRLAHAIEDCLVSLQKSPSLPIEKINLLFGCFDVMSSFSKGSSENFYERINSKTSVIETLITELSSTTPTPCVPPLQQIERNESSLQLEATSQNQRVLRMTAEHLNQLMGLAGEILVESHWLAPFEESLQEYRKQLMKISDIFNHFQNNLKGIELNSIAQSSLVQIQSKLQAIIGSLSKRVNEMDAFTHRHTLLSDKLYQDVILSRMRPFSDGIEAFPRMVRDLAQQLGKKVRLEIRGQNTLIDREILEKLESPLNHLLRNAVDHGIESPEERIAAKKTEEGVVILSAEQLGGMIILSVSDDGRGVDFEEVKKRGIARNVLDPSKISSLSDAELLELLFLPEFSTADKVSEISGRGMGLNIVQKSVQEFGGSIYVLSSSCSPSSTSTSIRKGVQFFLQFPSTRVVLRALLVEISGSVYAFPLNRIEWAFSFFEDQIVRSEQQAYVNNQGKKIPILFAHDCLGLEKKTLNTPLFHALVLKDHFIEASFFNAAERRLFESSDKDKESQKQDDNRNEDNHYCAIIIDCLIGEKELLLQELDPRLGKIPDIRAGALTEEGKPALVIDVDAFFQKADSILKSTLNKENVKKSILVVDDSKMIRETQMHSLLKIGYRVEATINGKDGWNAVCEQNYDLVITDIDMPQMTGIELINAMKNHSRLQNIPVMIVSTKDNIEKYAKEIESGAVCCLSKSSYSDSHFVEVVNGLLPKE